MRPEQDSRDGERPEADVILLLEGTYPSVRGGVSKWVHDLWLGLPEVRFGRVVMTRPALNRVQEMLS